MTERSPLIEINVGDQLKAVAFSANGERLVSGWSEGVRVWRMEDGKETAKMAARDVRCLAVSKDGRWVAGGTFLGELVLWEANSYEKVFTHKENGDEVAGLDFSPDSTRLVVASKNCTATIWDIPTRQRAVRPLDHEGGVIAAKYSPQGDRIATATKDSVRVYDSNDGRLLVDIELKVTPCNNTGLLWSNGQLFVVSEGKIKQLEASTGSAVSEWPVSDTNFCSCIALSEHGEFIAHSTNRTVTFWDTSIHAQLGLVQHTQVIRSIALSPDDRFLAIGGEDGKITIESLSHDTVPFIHISETALNSWKQDRLKDTEASLTITCSMHPSHHALASRALVRAHLGHWDTAIDDAENSIKIRPSIIGYIAKSVALIGGGKKEEGYRVIDFVFRHCDPIHVDLLLLIKAVVLFTAGKHDDAVSRVGNLIATVHLNSIFCLVQQAYMYLLLGNLHMENSNYESAVRLFERARDQIRYYVGLPLISISLISGWKFNDLGITIRQRLCEALYAVGRAKDAGECLLILINILDEAVHTSNPITNWVFEFKLRCYAKLVRLGNAAVDEQRHHEAITHYSAAITLNPDSPQGLFIKRSKARMAEGLWEDALTDANEANARDPSSPWGYETKHAVLRGAARYLDAIDAFETMLSKLDQSPDPNIRKRRGQYISPSRTRTIVRKIVQQTIRHSPRVLINISTGRLQNKAEQASLFESLPLFGDLVSSMTTRIDRGRIKREVRQYFRYVMLSHKWEENEPLFQQVMQTTVYDLDKSPTHDKVQVFCKIARDAGFNWAWCDTCCINTQEHLVLQEALVAMFKWYRGSALMIVFLRGVHSPAELGDLVNSIWNTRGWTLQEYIAAKVIHFYTEDWALYLELETPNHKESPEIISEMEQATGVSAQQLIALRPGLNSIREKLRLASTRHTTLEEDTAYSLLGIFSVAGIPTIYGEGESALGRLLAHILAGSGDASILAWSGQSSSYNSCLPARITVYSHLATSHLPPRIEDAEMESMVATLRASSLDADLALRLYDRLSELSPPWFTASRMKLPCIAFKLPPLSPYRTTSTRVYRVETPAFGMVEIKTRQDLSRLNSLYLVHPWLDTLLDREDTQNGAFVEDDVAEPSSPGTDDEDISDEEIDDESWLPELGSSLPPAPAAMVPMDRETGALQLIARLGQKFGALLFTLASTGRRAVEYKRVAADSMIVVQIQENVPLDELLDNVRILDVL